MSYEAWGKPDELSDALHDVIEERHRQQSVEGWSRGHDDKHQLFELSRAAATYAWNASGNITAHTIEGVPTIWPWSGAWWKPTDRRRDLVKAAALIVAEIERLDRAEKARP